MLDLGHGLIFFIRFISESEMRTISSSSLIRSFTSSSNSSKLTAFSPTERTILFGCFNLSLYHFFLARLI